MNHHQKKILVIQTAFPGDAILTLPMIQQLKKRNGNVLIDVICVPSTKIIFEASPHVNSVVELDKKGKQKSLLALYKFCRQLRNNNYDTIYSPHRSLRSAFITLESNVKETYGFDNSALKFAYRHIAKYNLSDHEVKRNLTLIGENYSSGEWKILPEISVSEEIRNNIDHFVKNEIKTKNIIAVAPGSVWQTKVYPAEHYKEIVKYFAEDGYTIALIGSEEDRDLSEQIKNSFDENILNLSGNFSIIETIEFLKHVKLLISNDSAPTHLGMCADIPVLTIFCSTVPAFGFYPYNDQSDFISFNNLDCKPCGIHGYRQCPIETFDCGYELQSDVVIEKIKNLLAADD
ncbi:MAG: glycosyltransferase family 9 protein [Ignavibacteriaceae bacterium]|nr:glycosyltransferase family 9 protein [Ignavibacteriaceae bacterium]